MRSRLELAGFCVGLVAIVAGIAQISVPWAYICGGMLLIAVSILARFSKP